MSAIDNKLISYEIQVGRTHKMCKKAAYKTQAEFTRHIKYRSSTNSL